MSKKKTLVIWVIAAATVMLLALSCAASTNSQPIIASLEPDVQGVVPLGIVQVVCAASDPDGDELGYDWSASAGEIEGVADTATWIAPAFEGSYSVTVEVTDGRGGGVTDYIVIAVRANNSPSITSLTPDSEWTTPSSNLQVICSASDPDGDELSYEWSASGGDISGTGAAVVWAAPEEIGVYAVTVVVRDGYGSSSTGALSIRVATGQPPNIEALIVTAEHCYLQEQSWGYRVGKEQEYEIECVVSDPSGELSYQWSFEGDEISDISQDGSAITWIAPDQSMYVTVTVVVSDIIGNMVGENILFEVVACSPCTFGC